MTVDPLDVLALLEEKPYTEVELLALFETSRQILTFTLKALKRDGRVTRVGSRWALCTVQAPPAPVRTPKPARPVPDVDEDLGNAEDAEDAEDAENAENAEDELAADDDAIADELEAEDLETDSAPPAQRVRGQQRLYPTGTRQAKLPKDITSGPGWWVAHAAPGQREQFRQAAAARNAEMCEKSPAWRSQATRNQSHK